MIIRELIEFSDFDACLAVQKSVWGFEDVDVVPSHLLRALSDSKNPWSILLGAFDGEQLLGFTFCLHTSRPDTMLLHMLAVMPGQQSKNLGYDLMQATASLARLRGIKRIVWTFDPLASANANLYLHKLKAVAEIYVDSYYQENTSPLHSGGIPSDRLKVEWNLDQKIATNKLDLTDAIFIAVPANFQELKKQDAKTTLAIRLDTRKKFHEHMTKSGLVAVDFVYDSEKNQGRYVLGKMLDFFSSLRA